MRFRTFRRSPISFFTPFLQCTNLFPQVFLWEERGWSRRRTTPPCRDWGGGGRRALLRALLTLENRLAPRATAPNSPPMAGFSLVRGGARKARRPPCAAPSPPPPGAALERNPAWRRDGRFPLARCTQWLQQRIQQGRVDRVDGPTAYRRP